MYYWLKWRVALLLFKVTCLARVLFDLQTFVYSIIITLALLNYITISNKEYHRLSTDVTQCRLEGLENQPNISDDTSYFCFCFCFFLNSTEQ